MKKLEINLTLTQHYFFDPKHMSLSYVKQQYFYNKTEKTFSLQGCKKASLISVAIIKKLANKKRLYLENETNSEHIRNKFRYSLYLAGVA